MKKINKKHIVFIIIAVVAFITVGIYYLIFEVPKNNYEEALSFAENGKYENAIEILNTMTSYKNSEKLIDEFTYEKNLLTCMKELKSKLKNPNSLVIYEVLFYTNENLNKETNTKVNYVTILNYGAQNGFGGMSSSYAIFTADLSLMGTCKSLDVEDYRGKTIDINNLDSQEAKEILAFTAIALHIKESREVGEINLERFNKVIKAI